VSRILDQSPDAFAQTLRSRGAGRAWLVRERGDGALRASHLWLSELAEFLDSGCPDERRHEAVFLAVGPQTGALFGAFLYRTVRGQAQGGLRHWPYPSVEAFLRDGLRLSLGMGRKNALAGLWWGGGKGLIARQPGAAHRSPDYRRRLYREYGSFVSSLRGCYVTAEDAGTSPTDLSWVFERTRFVTCIDPRLGGSGNPSLATAAGVVCAMEAALEALDLGTLAGKRVAMQGVGNVGASMVERLLQRGVEEIVASEISEEKRSKLLDRFAGQPLRIHLVAPADFSILAEACDILAPNAMGGVLGPETIPGIQAQLVCGAANNQLVDDQRDALALEARGITYVPDFLANRLGIVHCANEQYGTLQPDPSIERHLDASWEHSIQAVTKRVLAEAKREKIPPVVAANRLADALCEQPHPLWGPRTREIVAALVRDRWHEERA
jgi:glutamate dehydrogenase/leucine dehydrogenase